MHVIARNDLLLTVLAQHVGILNLSLKFVLVDLDMRHVDDHYVV
jgi:hypothetical protein